MHGSDRGLLFVHVPRTAGMAIRHALKLGTGELHVPIAELRRRLGSRRVDGLLSFAVVRNPWTRAISLYRKLASEGGNPNGFRQWVREGLKAPAHNGVSAAAPMARWLCEPGKLNTPAVDHVLRYENLEREWHRLRSTVEALSPLLVPESLPVVNASGSTADVERWYDAVTMDRVGDAYSPDVNLFGYARPTGVLPQR